MLRAQQYLFDLGPGSFLSVSLAGEQTIVSLHSDATGQQQSQQSSFPTGSWLNEPQGWEAHGVVYLRIQAQQGTIWLRAGHGQIGSGSPPPQDAMPMPSRAMTGPPRSKSATTMPPMQPMEMRMGNMAMRMGGEPAVDLQAENLKLREENLKLREEVLALREQLWSQRRGGSASS